MIGLDQLPLKTLGQIIFSKESEDQLKKVKVYLKQVGDEVQYFINCQGKALDNIYVKISKMAHKWSYNNIDIVWKDMEKIVKEGERASGKIVDWIEKNIMRDLSSQNITKILDSDVIPPPPPVVKQISQILAEIVKKDFKSNDWLTTLYRHRELYWLYIKGITAITHATDIEKIFENVLEYARDKIMETVDEIVENILNEVSPLNKGIVDFNTFYSGIKGKVDSWKQFFKTYYLTELSSLKAGTKGFVDLIENLRKNAEEFLEKIAGEIYGIFGVKNSLEKAKKHSEKMIKEVEKIREKTAEDLIKKYEEKINPFYNKIEDKIREVWNDYNIKPKWGSLAEIGKGLVKAYETLL
ncbi:MAG TPA: hypothetical protein ENG40_02785 [Thermoprotei archaeon]|nr:hypothetical protein [Thermoprotei archaeon]